MNKAPRQLLRNGNSDLKRDNIWVWSLPAWIVQLPDGKRINTCPSAGVCARHCYALKGTFMFRNVREAHLRNLMMVLDDLPGWERQMIAECQRPKMADAWVRIHDGGDFFSARYLAAWLRIARACPQTRFYCYTKEVVMFRQLVEPVCPPNFHYVFSYGGKHDDLITEDDRRCDVFPTSEDLEEAGFSDQAESDLLAVTGDKAVGIVVNRHPGAVNRMKGMSLRQQQSALRTRS